MSEEWSLYYWGRFAGRGDFVRLMFEEAGVKYNMVGDMETIRQQIILGNSDFYPHFAPPVIKKGDFTLSQAHVICRYLAEQFNMLPDTAEGRAHAEQVNLTCHDYIAEELHPLVDVGEYVFAPVKCLKFIAKLDGRLAFHGIYPVGSYFDQKEETQPYIDRFVKDRLPRWLKYFERLLTANNDGKGFVVDDMFSYVDITLYHVMRATEAQFQEAWTAADYIPKLKAFKERIAARPNIAAFLKSDRSIPFAGDSMM